MAARDPGSTVRRPRTWAVRVALLVVVLVAGRRAHALSLLTAGKVAMARNAPGEARVVVRVARDPALRMPKNPTCPTPSSLRFALSRAAADFEDHGEIPLDCAGWTAAGPGYRYRAPEGGAGGVREIVYGPRGLVIRAGGAGFAPLAGPVAYVEAWLSVGSERYLVRLQQFRRNDAERIVSRRPTRAGAAGETAFWDTLWADRPRGEEALGLLRKAVRRDPRDGRSHFLLGMLHLYRAGGNPAEFDFANLSEAAKAEGLAAETQLDRAVELLPQDTRVPGFRAAATYANGFAHGDGERIALGLGRLDEAIAVNPVFNSFDLFAVVPPTTSGASAYYQTRILELVDLLFEENADCIATLPELCNNAGMAPHNLEGGLILMGDIYAKGGRLHPEGNPLTGAEPLYALARLFGATSGYRYQAIAEERIARAAERVALYQDADPANDPPLLGGGGASCVYCHNK